MTAASLEFNDSQDSLPRRAGDVFLAGLMTMLAINVGQRAVGLARNVGFCHFLSESDLGLWALANSFFMIGAPIAVLGLPGSLGKFVEHYRLQGCLKPYLVRLTIASSLGVVMFCILMLSFPDRVSSVLYGQPLGMSTIIWTVTALVFLILFNTTAELVMSLRLVRMASLMHFINTAAFTGFGLAGIAWTGNWLILLPAYTLACISAILPGLWLAWRTTLDELKSTAPLPARRMWGRILPFAAALWCANLISNLFDLSDRYMLLHLCQAGVEQGQKMVGQFYCGRILPNLLLSIGMLLSGVLLPYLSAEWERRMFDKIALSMNNLLIALSIGFTGLSIVALTFSPVFFEWVLGGRYREAAEILPLGMTLACWSGLSTIAAAYLLCAERGGQNAAILGISLVANILFNWPLILWMGLYGAALATCISNGLLLIMVLWRVHREGCTIRWTTIVLCCLPISLLPGPTVSACVLLALFVVCGRTNWLLDDNDRRAIDGWIVPYMNYLRLPIQSLWPSHSGTG